MQLRFIAKNNSDRLILIFAGWSSGLALYDHIRMPGYDIAVIYGICPGPVDWSEIRRYPTVFLFAWSLGVYSAMAHLPQDINICAAYAVNGTPAPYSKSEGIPEDVFRGTAERLDERNLRKFRMRMFNSVEDFKEKESLLGYDSSIDELRGELEYVMQNPVANTSSIRWDAVFIGENDRIFPAANQKKAWSDRAVAFTLNEPHYIDLQQIINKTVINTKRVGQRFSRSLSTYNAHAHAQRLIAETLINDYLEDAPQHLDNVIEVGPGSGLFTYIWSKGRSCSNAIFIDVGDMPVYNVAETEEYIQHDAEAVLGEFARQRPHSADAIFSSSSIQWMSNLRHFFSCCAKVLKPGGFILMSTFAPGNLQELLTLRPDHIRYVPADQIESMLRENFSSVRVHEDIVELDFTSPLEALRHLQLTGVTTSGHKADLSKLRRFAEQYPANQRQRYSLTFRPIYLFARL